MFVPKTTADGMIDLGDAETRLHFVNRALRIFTTHSDPNGWLQVSSSEKLLARYLTELTPAQVAEINRTLHVLGLRETKPGGDEHFIRIDVLSVTLEELRANKRIRTPSKMLNASDALVEALELALAGLEEKGELVPNSPFVGRLAIVPEHMEIIEGLADGLAVDVMFTLRNLALFRVYMLNGKPICFIQPGCCGNLTRSIVDRGSALLEWPNSINELLPPELLVDAMPADQMIIALVEACDRLEAQLLEEKRARSAAEQELAAMQVEVEKLIAACERFEAGAKASAEERATMATRIADLEKEISHLKVSPVVLNDELRAKIARYTSGGASDGA